MKNFFKEFKAFALKGNVISMAVGIIIGGAFQGVVSSLTENIISPLLGFFTKDNLDFSGFVLFGLRIGAFINSVISFVIMAFIIFLMLKIINTLLVPGDEAVTPPVSCPYCFSEVKAQATRCPSCTSVLVPVDPPSTPRQPEDPPQQAIDTDKV